MKLNFAILCTLICLSFLTFAKDSVLNRGNGSEVDSLNIHQAQGLNSHNVLRDLYEGLMTLDAHGKPIYGVAKSHKVKGNVWTFYLRHDAKWSDGSSVIASDFVRGWQKAVNPKTAAPYAFLLDNIVHAKKIIQMKLPPKNLVVKAVDDYTLQVNLWKPDSAFLEKLSMPVFYPVPKVEGEKHKMVSNGAYKISHWVVQEKIELVKNAHYYDKEKVYFDRVNYWVTENQSSELKRFRAGELDITESIPDSQIKWLQENLADELHISPYLGTFFLGLNLADKNLKNHKLRQALSLAINRDILTQKVLKTGQKPAYHIIPRELVGIKDNYALDDRTNASKKAQELFQQTGLKASDLKIEILYNNSGNQRKVAIAIAAMWRQTLGIRAKLLNQEWKVFVQSRKSIKRQAFRSGWIADYADALSFLELFTSTSRFNFYRYKNQQYDDLVDAIKVASDINEKNRLTEQAEKHLLNDIPVIPLYYYVSRHLVNNQILGYFDNVSDRHLSKFLYTKGELR